MPDQVEVHGLLLGDLNREPKGLPVIPVVEGGQTVPARVRRREPECRCLTRKLDGMDGEVVAYREGARRELDEEGHFGMDVAVATPLEPQLAQRLVKGALPDVALQDEIRVLRDVRSGVDSHARAAGEHGSYPALGQVGSNGKRDVLQRGIAGQGHSGLPARRGRRLSAAVRSRRSRSASANRERNPSSCSRAKYLGLSV